MLTIVDVDARVTHVSTRIPFRYGIAEMTRAPHALIEVTIEGEGGRASGWASEHLPPRWFTKVPDSDFADEVVDMVAVIEHARSAATGLRGASAFEAWHRLHDLQAQWAREQRIPQLLAGLGTSLVERALIDACCRMLRLPFPTALATGALGFDPASIHPELSGRPSRLPAHPARTIAVRHTIGLTDPLTDAEVADAPDDLPVSLEAAIRTQGVSHFKIKTHGDAAHDVTRLSRIAEIAAVHGIRARYTIDGNESMHDPDDLVSWARTLTSAPELSGFMAGLVALEQPLSRDVALSPQTRDALARLQGIPVIIDESDDDLDTVRRAMDLGYAGGTYKGCKGVFRGLANAELAAHRASLGHRTAITAEDLSTLPPLTVPQDLVVAATMGLTHIERNGHHFFARLAPLGEGIEHRALAAHPDLYRLDGDTVRLRIDGGAFELGSTLKAPFGFGGMIDASGLPPLTPETAVAGLR